MTRARSGGSAADGDVNQTAMPGLGRSRMLPGMVFAVILVLVTGRFFTERIVGFPHFINGIDMVAVPVMALVFVMSSIGEGRRRFEGRRVISLTGLFVLSWGCSWVMNYREVNWIGALLLCVGLLTPIVLYLIVINASVDEQFTLRMIMLLNILFAVNLVITLVETVRDFGSEEFIVLGTFGANQNQLAFFLAFMMAYHLAYWMYRGVSVFRACSLGVAALMFLMAGFQTLWLVFAVACGVVFLCIRPSKRLVVIFVVVIVSVPLWSAVLERLARFDLGQLLEVAEANFDELGKVRLIRSAPVIWESRPLAVLWGVGPGTFNSRAFRTIALIPSEGPFSGGRGDATDVAAAIIEPFYVNELADRFIIPWYGRTVSYFASGNVDAPHTSYISIPVEVGLIGALAIFGIYASVGIGLVRSVRSAADPRVRVLAAWALISLLMLLGIATIDNYLETTRYSILVWLAIAMWRVHSRPGPNGG